MKVGAENKRKTVVAAVLVCAAVGGLLWQMRSSGPGASAAPAATDASGSASSPHPRAAQAQDRNNRYISMRLMPTLDPRLRLDLLKSSEGVGYEGTGRNIFSEHAEPDPQVPTPNGPGLTDRGAVGNGRGPWVPQSEAPPDIQLKFYGWASKPGEPRAVFLAKDDSVFVAHEGDIIARRYKVVRIMPKAVEIEDLLSNNKQSIPLSEG
jgi:hypothetical protein